MQDNTIRQYNAVPYKLILGIIGQYETRRGKIKQDKTRQDDITQFNASEYNLKSDKLVQYKTIP